jgi:hypothetical protein
MGWGRPATEDNTSTHTVLLQAWLLSCDVSNT